MRFETNHVDLGAVLWRASLLDPGGVSYTRGHAARLTLIDLIPELFGIASLWLKDDFFQNYSRHFAHTGEYEGPTSLAALRARKAVAMICRTLCASAQVRCSRQPQAQQTPCEASAARPPGAPSRRVAGAALLLEAAADGFPTSSFQDTESLLR